MRLQVNDFMTTNVITAEETTTVGEIRNIMKRNRIHAVPIMARMPNDEWGIQGIVTATDLCKRINDATPINEVMNDCRVHVVRSNMGAQAAAKNMLKHKVHHLVVMDDGNIIGMISSQDFVKLVAKLSLKPKKVKQLEISN